MSRNKNSFEASEHASQVIKNIDTILEESIEISENSSVV